MNLKRIVAFGAVGGACAAWIASAAMTGARPVPDVRVVPPTPVERHGAALDAEIARLRERLRPTAQPQRPARNIFSFAATERPQVPVGAAPAPAPDASKPDAAPARPGLTLIGFAETNGAEGVTRTAIISGAGDLFLVEEGETVTNRYRVTVVAADGVVLTDAFDGSTISLHLK
jgi:hypothetical protein